MAIVLDPAHLALFQHVGSELARGAGKGRRHQARVGVTVVGAERGAFGNPPYPWKPLMQLLAIEYLQVKPEPLATIGIGLQRGQVLDAAGQLEMPGALVFAVDADQFGQAAPDPMGPLGQWQLRQRPALAPHPAIVHPAGVAATEIPFQQYHAAALAAQGQCCAGADDATAKDCHLDFDHGVTSSPNGSGLIGAWARKRPMASRARPLSQAMISAAAAPQIRPWQRPMLDLPMPLANPLTHLADPYFLTAAEHQFVRGVSCPVRGEGEGILQALTELADARQAVFQVDVTVGVDAVALVLQQCQSGAFASHLCGIGTHDAGTVTGQVNARDAAAPGTVLVR